MEVLIKTSPDLRGTSRACWPDQMSFIRLLRMLWMGCFPLFFIHLFGVNSLAEVSKEYQVKAVFLFRLAQFVDWPTTAFENDQSPVIIGVLGADPFGEALNIAVQGETAHNRPIVIRRFQKVKDITACHVLFISRSEADHISEVIAALYGRSILTVSDIEDFVSKNHGMVHFVTQLNKVDLRIDPEAAKSARLVFDSRLLRMAKVVNKH